MGNTPFRIEPLTDTELLKALLSRRWGEDLMMFGRTWKRGEYQAIVARDEKGEVLGLATHALQKSTILALTIDNFSERRGIGKALLDHVAEIGRQQGGRALRVLTTNDNTPALRYFQKLGFRIVALYPGAVMIYRTVAPNLPEIGVDGIPVRDAIELEIDL
ncbi:MAG TPA: GNAT family N-acetyltransferase [Rhabdaerophilum sp.]|nr:GNAT family N-acetyltransferase [Rhabdaerophilum sp.]